MLSIVITLRLSIYLSLLHCSFKKNYIYIADNIFHLDVHYVRYTILVQRLEPQGGHFTNFHYYYHDLLFCVSGAMQDTLLHNGYRLLHTSQTDTVSSLLHGLSPTETLFPSVH